MGRSDLGRQVAPVWKQALAGLIDGLPSSVLLVVLVRRRRRDAHEEQHLIRRLASVEHRLVRRLEVVNAVYGVVAPVAFGQTFGQWALGIRVVGQDTGRRPSLTQSIICWAFAGGPPMILHCLPRSTKQMQLFDDVVAEEVAELKVLHEGDRKALNKAVFSLYEERGFSPIRACLPEFLRSAVSWLYCGLTLSSALRHPLNQSFGERMAKTLIVRDVYPQLTRG